MGLLGYSLCIFFTLTIFSSVFFIFLIVFNFMKTPNLKSEKQSLRGISTLEEKLFEEGFNDYLKEEPNESENIIELSHKRRLISILRRTEFDVSKCQMKGKDNNNLYNVRFKGKKNSNIPKKKRLCDLPVILFTRVANNYDFVLNGHELNEILNIDVNKDLKCAVVSNSGALNGSNLGEEIDSHDFVMRFNNAPTLGFERDVGSKTSIRLINSQLLLNPNFNIISSQLYRNRVKFVWDASHYNSDYNQWFNKSHEFFKSYDKIVKMFSNETIAILDPKLIWNSWDLLQTTTRVNIPKNPPTSGFLGIIILLKFCSQINIYEYIPSLRMTDICHYYDTLVNRGCTLGQWHPLSTEKLFILSLNEGKEVASKGKVSLKGCYSSIKY